MNHDFVGCVNYSDRTKNRYLALIRSILNIAAHEWQWLGNVPKITLYRKARRHVHRLMQNEAQKLIAALLGYLADMAIFKFGCRIQETKCAGFEVGANKPATKDSLDLS
ncbi:hypothetical protein [Neisseria musculi]|uniref:hypothetical protein n=1 Tax=Neisseria musculi TaxID=1815583 RepID=UPI00164A3E68|nr:hypothetical protein [Neisseria musculi]